MVKNTWPVSSGPGVDYPANPLLSYISVKQGAMSDNREPEVTGAPSADARSVEAVAEAVARARGPANFT